MGYIPGEPDDGFLNGAIPDEALQNSAAVGSSNAPVEPEAFDPSAHTVDDVISHVEDHPDELAAVLAAEKTGKARVTLLAALDPPVDDA